MELSIGAWCNLTLHSSPRDLRDLERSSLPLYVSGYMWNYYKGVGYKPSTEQRIMRRAKVFPLNPEALEALYERLRTRQDVGVMMQDTSCHVMARMTASRPHQSPRLHVIHGYCLIGSYSHHIMLHQQSPLIEVLDKLENRLDETGLPLVWNSPYNSMWAQQQASQVILK